MATSRVYGRKAKAPAEAERASDLALRLRRAEDGPETCSRLSRRLAGCSPWTARFAAASLTPLLASRLLHAPEIEQDQHVSHHANMHSQEVGAGWRDGHGRWCCAL